MQQGTNRTLSNQQALKARRRRQTKSRQRSGRKRRLESIAEGTLANTGRVLQRPAKQPYTKPAVGNQRLRVLDEPRPRYRQASGFSQPWGYAPRYQGKLVRLVHESTPPPHCIYCGGPTYLARRSISSFHVEKAEERWECTDPSCPGREDAVIYMYPMGEYNRRG